MINDGTKHCLNRLNELQKQIDTVRSLISSDQDKEIVNRIKRYIDAEHPTNQGYGYPSDKADFSWTIDNNRLEYKWDESWSYGGRDDGYGCMSLDYFMDDGQVLEAYEAKRKAEKDALKAEAEENKRKEKLRQFESLKVELGQ